MPHNLFRDRMAFVDHVPWHGHGEAVASTVTATEMCRAAGLNWEVTKQPALGARIVNKQRALHDRYLIMRQSVGHEKDAVALGMVGSGYEPLQKTEAFKFFEPFIEGKYAQFHTAGALGNGERVWVLVKLNDQIVIGDDDIVDRFLLLSNSHGGTGAVSIRFTPIQVVCQNTLNFAMKRGSGAISVRHTRNVARHLATAQGNGAQADHREGIQGGGNAVRQHGVEDPHRRTHRLGSRNPISPHRGPERSPTRAEAVAPDQAYSGRQHRYAIRHEVHAVGLVQCHHAG